MPVVSPLIAAAPGFYDVNWTMANDRAVWGKKAGCSFWKDACNEVTPASVQSAAWCFPADPTAVSFGCDYGLSAIATCNAEDLGFSLPDSGAAEPADVITCPPSDDDGDEGGRSAGFDTRWQGRSGAAGGGAPS
eukprot:gene50919-4556_t